MTIKANNDGNKTKNREEGERREKKKGKGIEGEKIRKKRKVVMEVEIR